MFIACLMRRDVRASFSMPAYRRGEGICGDRAAVRKLGAKSRRRESSAGWAASAENA